MNNTSTLKNFSLELHHDCVTGLYKVCDGSRYGRVPTRAELERNESERRPRTRRSPSL